MAVKWYWPMKMLGLVQELSGENGEQWRVSARCDTVMWGLILLLPLLLFLLGLLLQRGFCRKKRENTGRKLLLGLAALLLLYGLFLALGLAPYLQLYPQGGGFLSMDTLEDLIRGLYAALLAGALWLGGRRGGKKK